MPRSSSSHRRSIARHHARLARIERLLTPPEPEVHEAEGICDEEWLAHFRLYGQKGWFRHEPDFPQALKEYEQAIALAKRDPAHLPTSEFMPHVQEIRRRRYWREGTAHRAVERSWLWLCAMYNRIKDGIPAVTLSEWDMLTTWFKEHRSQVRRWTLETIDSEMTVTQLMEDLNDIDARHVEAGKFAMLLRQLYARYQRRKVITHVTEQAPSEESGPACQARQRPSG